MAKAKVTAAKKAPAILVKIEQAISLLAIHMKTVECTAICVEFALLHQNADEDREIAWCVHRNIVDELGRLRERVQEISRALGGKPHNAATRETD